MSKRLLVTSKNYSKLHLILRKAKNLFEFAQLKDISWSIAKTRIIKVLIKNRKKVEKRSIKTKIFLFILATSQNKKKLFFTSRYKKYKR